MLSEKTGTNNWLYLITIVASVCIACFIIFGVSPFLILVIPICIPLFIQFYKVPEYLFYLIIVMIPLDALSVLTQKMPSLTVAKLAGILLTIIAIIYIILNKKTGKFVFSSLWKSIVLFTCVIIISTIPSIFMIKELPMLKLFFQTLLFTALTQFIIVERTCLKGIEKMILTGTSISALCGIYGYIFKVQSLMLFGAESNNLNNTRVLGGSNDPNAFAVSILFGIPFITLYLLQSSGLLKKFFWSIILVINISGVLLSFSRSGILILFLLISYLLYEIEKNIRKERKFIFYILLIIGSIPILMNLSDNIVFKRVKTLTTGDTSLSRRMSYYKVAIQKIKEKPFLGWGINGFPNLYAKSLFPTAFLRGASSKVKASPESYFRAPHNSYIDVTISAGLVGLTFLLIIIIKTLRTFKNEIKKASKENKLRLRMYICAFMTILLGVVFLSNIYHKYIWFIIGTALALTTKSEILDCKNEEADKISN